MAATLSNSLLRATFAQGGNLDSLCLAGSGFNPWNGRPSRLIIVDGRRRRTYSDVQSPMTVKTTRTRTRIESAKHLKGADFVARETWRVTRDALVWTVEVSLKPGRRERSIQVRQLLPYPNPCYGLGVWTAHPQFPTHVERLGGLNLQYGELCYGTALPSLTFYSREPNVGLTVTKPFDLRTSRLSFSFMDYRSEGVEMHTSHLALRKGAPAKTEFLIHPHEGCWRPGLAWLYGKFPKYFDPPNPRVREIEGGYLLGHPHMSEADFASALPQGLKWEELHCHFPWYGDYLPEAGEWTSCDTWEACVAWDVEANAVGDEATLGATDLPPPEERRVSPHVIRDHVDMVHQHGVKTLFYWQSGGDGSPCIQEKFPDSIARDKAGAPYPSAVSYTHLRAHET